MLPDVATVSMEADLVPPDDADDRLADLIDGSIGEGSLFHRQFGVYADGVSSTTARLPDGWQARLVPFRTPATGGVTAYCLDPADLLVSKYLVGRPKDLQFCAAVMAANLVNPAVVAERLAATAASDAERATAESRLLRHTGANNP